MSGSHAIKTIFDLERPEHPLFTLHIGSQPNYIVMTKTHQRTALFSCYLNKGFSGDFLMATTIDHRNKVTNDSLQHVNRGNGYNTYHQIGKLDVKTGSPLIARLYQSLREKHNYPVSRKWMTGVFFLIRSAYHSKKGNYYSTILAIAPDVPSGSGEVAIETSGWQPVSNELLNYLLECQTKR